MFRRIFDVCSLPTDCHMAGRQSTPRLDCQHCQVARLDAIKLTLSNDAIHDARQFTPISFPSTLCIWRRCPSVPSAQAPSTRAPESSAGTRSSDLADANTIPWSRSMPGGTPRGLVATPALQAPAYILVEC
eukprot:1188581-Prorocentrum_minimum.AAC.4